jgi:thiol-disulfide isomerase/thioredoxin
MEKTLRNNVTMMNRPFGRQPLLLFALSLAFLGCATTGDRHDHHGHEHHASLSPDDLPLMPRRSVQDRWEDRKQPLPPLPSNYSVAEAKTVPTPSDLQGPVANLDSLGELEHSEMEEGHSHDHGDDHGEEAHIDSLPPAEIVGSAVASPVDPLDPSWSAEKGADDPVASAPGAAPSGPSKVSLEQIAPEDLASLVESYQGKVLVLNCWGIDCGPCIEEMPHLNEIHQELKGEGLAIAAINTDIEMRYSDVEKFVQKSDFGFDFYLRAPGPDTRFRQAIDSEYAADPFTIIFDRNGLAVAKIADALSKEDWKKILSAAVKGEPIPNVNPEVMELL